MRRKTKAEKEWIRENAPKMTHRECLDAFEDAFGWRMDSHSFSLYKSKAHIKSKPTHMEWTSEMHDFMREYIPGHEEREIREAFARRFGYTLTEGQIANEKVRLGVKSGTCGGRFEKGQPPVNKGKTWDEFMSPEGQAASRATQFKKGNEPLQGKRVPVGSERVSKDGYVEVKVRRFSERPCTNRCWRMKHALVWEEANGRPVPDGHVIAFADSDKRNFDPDNLVAVPRELWAVIHNENIEYADRRTLLAAVDIARVRRAIYGARCRPRPCKRCGAEFRARYPTQKTCDECLGRE